MGLFRTTIFLCGLAVFMPSPPDKTSGNQNVAAIDAPSTSSLLSAATSAVVDLGSFCGRQPDVCHTAGYVAYRMEAKAKYSAKLIYEWASEASEEPRAAQPEETAENTDPLQTSAFKVADLGDQNLSQSTLRLEDLIPEWRGPILPKKG